MNFMKNFKILIASDRHHWILILLLFDVNFDFCFCLLKMINTIQTEVDFGSRVEFKRIWSCSFLFFSEAFRSQARPGMKTSDTSERISETTRLDLVYSRSASVFWKIQTAMGWVGDLLTFGAKIEQPN